MSGTSEGARKGWLHRRRAKPKSALPSEKQRTKRTVGGILRKGNHPEVQKMIRNTPSTGHAEGSSRKMVKEVNNWPASWLKSEAARARLKQDIARDPGETYVYYPIGSHRPVIYSHGRRYSLEEYRERNG